MTENQLHILRHSLGLNLDGSGRIYRNHFVTGPGQYDYDVCMALVSAGHMQRRVGSDLSGGDDIFRVTKEGIAEALKDGAAAAMADTARKGGEENHG